MARVESFMALIPVRSEVDYLASNHTKQSLRPQRPLGAQIEVTLPRERFSPLADLRRTCVCGE